MQMEWHSRTGTARSHNSDAVALCVWESKAVIALVDAAQSNSSAALASRWAQACVLAAAQAQRDSTEAIIDALRNAHSGLRHAYLHDRASYLLALIDVEQREGTLLFAGDCLLGIGSSGTPVWLNTPHTAEAHLLHYLPEHSMAIQGAEHALTRCFKGRRFTVPEHRSFVWSEGVSLFFSTDGHWREHVRDGASLEQLQDDASLLRVSYSPASPASFSVQQQTDTPNLIIVDRGNLPDLDQDDL